MAKPISTDLIFLARPSTSTFRARLFKRLWFRRPKAITRFSDNDSPACWEWLEVKDYRYFLDNFFHLASPANQPVLRVIVMVFVC